MYSIEEYIPYYDLAKEDYKTCLKYMEDNPEFAKEVKDIYFELVTWTGRFVLNNGDEYTVVNGKLVQKIPMIHGLD